jgi:hypothetical protein
MDDAEIIWSAAEAARKTALRAALHDKLLWVDQLVNVVCGAIKALCVAMALSAACSRIGFPEGTSAVLAALVTMPTVVFNPWAFFWRNLFSERADAAFAAAVRDFQQS